MRTFWGGCSWRVCIGDRAGFAYHVSGILTVYVFGVYERCGVNFIILLSYSFLVYNSENNI